MIGEAHAGLPAGTRVVGERDHHDGRFAGGRPVYVRELRWNGGPVSYDVYDAGTDACLTEGESFDHYPTDADLERVAEWVRAHPELAEDFEHNHEMYARRLAERYPVEPLLAVIGRAGRGEWTWERAYRVIYAAL